MYRAALIQNESEMLRYGCADIRPMLTNIDYQWKSFTAERLSELFAELPLGRYDAIIIATNACNDQNVRAILQQADHQEALQQFLERGAGIYVSFQMRLTDLPCYGLLPAPFDIAAINRKELGTEGHLAVPIDYTEHILYKHPHPVTIDEIVQQCLHNEFAKSLYRGYLKPLHDGVYDVLLIDDAYAGSRPLVLCSRSDFPGRIVITSIPLDWQRHQKWLENVVHYVVEGQPYLAVIEKYRDTDFDFQYLMSSLEVTKVPFSRYVQSKLDFSKILFGIHDTIILDSSWTYQDIVTSNYSDFSEEFDSGARLFFFGRINAKDPIVSYIGGPKGTQILLPATLTWLKSQYKDGRWRGSFWHTFDVVESFVELGISVEEYRDEVLASIEPHNIEGSYDEVIGATCAMLKIYKTFLGKDDNKFKQSLQWIRRRFPEASFYEQATAIDTLNEVGEPFDQEVLIQFRAKAKALFPSIDDELRLYRYAKTLFSSRYVEDALRICLKLSSYQTDSGSWVNVARTASIILLLMEIQRKLDNPSKKLDEMIFKGITFLKSTYDPENSHWHDDVPSTAKALRAVIEFEQRILFPIDELTQTLQRFEKKAHELKAIEIATSQNARLQKEKSDLKQRLKREVSIRAFSTKLATLLAIVSAPAFTLFFLLLFHIIRADQFPTFWDYFKGFLKDRALEVSTSVALIPITVLYLILRAFNTIPRLKIIPAEWEEAILHRLLVLCQG